MGYVALRQDDQVRARSLFIEAQRHFKEIGSKIGVTYALEGLASSNVFAGNPVKATRLIGWADATSKEADELRPPVEQKDVDQDKAACRLALGEEAFTHAYEAGRVMTLEQAVAYALEGN